MVNQTFSSVQDVINFGLVPIEEGKENIVVDGCRAIQRGHAPGQEGTLKEKNVSRLDIFCQYSED